MSTHFLLYGSTGFVGDVIARLAVERGLRPILAGRNATKVETQAAELGAEYRVFSLDEPIALDKALAEVSVVLHCAGPYLYTYKPMVEGCLRTGTHYMDLTGEIPVFEALAALDNQAKEHHVMLLPGAGFDVAATDCLALHLKQRLPSATHLALAFCGYGPAGLPPGTANSIMERIQYINSTRVRRNGQLETIPWEMETRLIDFGRGPVEATQTVWGDVFTAFYSTGIPNITNYLVYTKEQRSQYALVRRITPLLKLGAVRRFIRRLLEVGSTAEERATTHMSVWGEVRDEQGGKAVSRLYGPEAGVVWTSLAALAAIRRVQSGEAPPGYQTPARAYGADFVLECEGVTREDVL